MMRQCFLVATHTATMSGENFDNDTHDVRCETCGHYRVTREARINRISPECGYILTEYIMKKRQAGDDGIVDVTTTLVSEVCGE